MQQRTQIYLPEDLRQEIDRQRRLTGESLAEYLRSAAESLELKELEISRYARRINYFVKS